MKKEEIYALLMSKPKFYLIRKNFKKYFPEIFNEIERWNFPQDFKWTQKLYHYLNDDVNLELGICPISGNRTSFQTFGKGYSKYYSVKHSKMDEDVMDKLKQTCLEKYGCENPFQADVCKKKSIETCLKKYGSRFYSQSDEYKLRFHDEILPKAEQTNLEKYGKRSFAQSNLYHKNKTYKFKHGDITFDSTWEIITYEYFNSMGCEIEYQPNIKLEYEYDGKSHYYQPDFLIDGNLYEVKGEHFFDGDKMINPFDREQDGLFEAKHQCMLRNNVIILRKEDIDEMKKRLI